MNMAHRLYLWYHKIPACCLYRQQFRLSTSTGEAETLFSFKEKYILFTVREVESRLACKRPALFCFSDQLACKQLGGSNRSVSNQAEPCFKRPCSPWAEAAFMTQNRGDEPGPLPSPLELVYSVWAYPEESAALRGGPMRHLYMCNWCVSVCVCG